MENSIVIAIDHGNKNIKTAHELFNAGIMNNGPTVPAIRGDNILYKDNYYTLISSRLAKHTSKTEDEAYYVLTLFAIAKELLPRYPNGYTGHITLAAGLPPADMSRQSEEFSKYLRRDGEPVEFVYNDVPFEIIVDDVYLFPQNYAAVRTSTEYSRIASEPVAYLIDIGGGTTDIIKIVNGKADGYYRSLQMGANDLSVRIQRIISERTGTELDEVFVHEVLRGRSINNKEVQKVIEDEAKNYANELFRRLKDQGVDFVVSLPVFLGGGSIVLKQYLEPLCGRTPIWLNNIKANAIGYETLAKKLIPGATA